MTADDAAAAFMADRVPAAVTWEPHLTEGPTIQRGMCWSTASPRQASSPTSLAVLCDSAEKRGNEIKAVVRAWNCAVDYWKAHPQD